MLHHITPLLMPIVRDRLEPAIRPSSHSRSVDCPSVRFSSLRQGSELKTAAAIFFGALGCFWWNSAIFSPMFLTLAAGSQLSSSSPKPSQRTKYCSPFQYILLSRICSTSNSSSPSTSTALGGGGRNPLTSLPFQGESQFTWKTLCTFMAGGSLSL